jgi:hypothetical protein
LSTFIRLPLGGGVGNRPTTITLIVRPNEFPPQGFNVHSLLFQSFASTFSKLFLAALPFAALIDGDYYWQSRYRRTTAHGQLFGKTYAIKYFYQEDFFKDVPPV